MVLNPPARAIAYSPPPPPRPFTTSCYVNSQTHYVMYRTVLTRVKEQTLIRLHRTNRHCSRIFCVIFILPFPTSAH
jgi:hypothetical protein